ncbi:hypothetical protein PENSPDRAFT_208426 [Peniophora sp. CONT]|nr:hypothetical protein PENSPDRAFT_208426 [Peniophora sp. CONT]
MNAQGFGNNGAAVNPWAALGMPHPGAPAAAGEQPQVAPNPLLAQLQNMMHPGVAAPPQNPLWANPQLALMAMQLMQGQQPQAQQSHIQPQPQPAPQPEPQLSPRQAKEKMYRDAQSEQLDATLAFFISGAQSAGESKFAGLEDMNNRHGHSVEWWKDYYIIHQTRLDALIATFNNQAYPTQTDLARALPGSSKRPRAPSSSSSSIVDVTDEVLASSSGRPLKASRRMREREEAPSSSSARNSSESHKTDLAVPSVLPSEPPHPPTNTVVFSEGKNRYTSEDETFFVNLILWHAKTSPGASKRIILSDIAEKASHHSLGSWGCFWTAHKGTDILERGLRMARLEAESRAVKNEARD